MGRTAWRRHYSDSAKLAQGDRFQRAGVRLGHLLNTTLGQ